VDDFEKGLLIGGGGRMRRGGGTAAATRRRRLEQSDGRKQRHDHDSWFYQDDRVAEKSLGGVRSLRVSRSLSRSSSNINRTQDESLPLS